MSNTISLDTMLDQIAEESVLLQEELITPEDLDLDITVDNVCIQTMYTETDDGQEEAFTEYLEHYCLASK